MLLQSLKGSFHAPQTMACLPNTRATRAIGTRRGIPVVPHGGQSKNSGLSPVVMQVIYSTVSNIQHTEALLDPTDPSFCFVSRLGGA